VGGEEGEAGQESHKKHTELVSNPGAVARRDQGKGLMKNQPYFREKKWKKGLHKNTCQRDNEPIFS